MMIALWKAISMNIELSQLMWLALESLVIHLKLSQRSRCSVSRKHSGFFLIDYSHIPLSEAPKFDLDINGKEIRIRAGEPLDINLPMTGSPIPTVTWLKGETPLTTNNDLIVEADDSHTRLLIPVSKRSDSGSYTVKAHNDSGSAEATCRVIVMGE